MCNSEKPLQKGTTVKRSTVKRSTVKQSTVKRSTVKRSTVTRSTVKRTTVNCNPNAVFQDLTSEDANVGRPVSPCNVVFVGDNIVPSKSSLSSKPKVKKVKIVLSIFW